MRARLRRAALNTLTALAVMAAAVLLGLLLMAYWPL
jgi:hypothetical protein